MEEIDYSNMTKAERKRLKKERRMAERQTMNEQRNRQKRRKKIITYSIIGLMILLIGYMAYSSTSTDKVYSSIDGTPVMVFDELVKDLGVVSQAKGDVSTDFTITNTGDGNLVIKGMETSCMCTTASLIYKGKESPEFGMAMHGNPKGWSAIIPSGESATLRVIYDPNAHRNLLGSVTREISLYSNAGTKQVKIKLNQVR
ncbi:MAG: DUF1573 domain-containing protein [Nitrosopumilus sp.]